RAVTVDLLVSGAFTGWRGAAGTFEHWIRPALGWFRSRMVDEGGRQTAGAWDRFVEPLPPPRLPRTPYAVVLRLSALATALHGDSQWGAVASGVERGIRAYCWPRDAIA